MATRVRFNIDAEVRRLSRREKREEATPLVIYNRGYSYGTARLATIRDLMALSMWPPDYSAARVITNPDDLETIGRAEDTIRAARKAADHVYAQAYARGETIDPEQAEAAARLMDAS